MKKNPVIWAIVLAAGESKRMNGPKLLLPFQGATIIETLVAAIRKSGVAGIMMVLGGWREEMMKVVEPLSVDYCINEEYKTGMLSSVICGLKALPGESDGALIFPGDQPWITPGVADAVISAFNQTGKGIIIACHNGKRGHPVLVGRKYFTEVERIDPSVGLRSLQIAHPGDVFEVETGNDGILKDIDTPKDYLSATI